MHILLVESRYRNAAEAARQVCSYSACSDYMIRFH